MESKEETNKTSYLDEVPNIDKDVLLKMWNEAMPKLETKQETLEEAADRLAYDSTEENKGFPKIKVFKDGAEWQAEKMYEIMNAYADDVMGGCNLRAKEWFEQNKNK